MGILLFLSTPVYFDNKDGIYLSVTYILLYILGDFTNLGFYEAKGSVIWGFSFLFS